jgi:cell migration-inducing and hyaluronan-binding protein
MLGLPLAAAPAAERASEEAVASTAATGAKLWSDPKTWRSGKVPGPDARVVVPFGSKIVLDGSPPPLGSLRVDGTLAFRDKDLSLSADWIVVHGTLKVGTESNPFKHRAVITLTGDDPSVDIMDMGTKVLGVMGGTLDLHGRRVKGWTRLAKTAQPGASTVTLAGDRPWKAGDRIVIASSDYWRRHDEERTVTAVSGRTLELDEPLEYQHWGTLQSFGGGTVDERAEVGVLTRNIVVQGNDASLDNGFGGHLMVMAGSTARIEGVEFELMGQRNRLRRYPVHFHMDGSASGSYLKRSSIHHTFNRCVVIHGTNHLFVTGNVCYDNVGHAFFLEDGAEHDNLISGNLGLGTKANEAGLLPTDDRPATFWITNPDNTVRNNVAAGSDGPGFWYALPEHPTGLSHDAAVWPRRTPLKEFSDNVAHSNGDSGVNVDDGPRPDGNTESTYYRPVFDPTDSESDTVTATFKNLTAYMNRDRGIWLRGENHVVTGAVLADNRSGATFASSESFLEDSLVVGETANMGTTEPWEDPGFEGRALPFFWEPDAQIVGFEFYDGRVGVRNTTFVGFNPNPVRPSGALGYLAPDAFSIHPKNFAEGIQFVDSNRVYLAPVEPDMDGDASKVFVDKDGSVTGSAGSTVVVDNPFLLQPGCAFRAEWTAHVCTSDYVTLLIGANNPNAIKPVTLERGDGSVQTLMGCCDDSTDAQTTAIPNRAYDVAFNGGTPQESSFVLWRGKGRWVELNLTAPPGSTVTRWGHPLSSVTSQSALDAKNDSAYFYNSATSTLHLKIVGNGDWEEIHVEKP